MRSTITSAHYYYVKAGLLSLVFCYATPASGLEYLHGDLQVHGFLTQGIVFTSDNHYFGDSQNGSLDFREIGVNALLQINPDIHLSGQVLSRRAGEISEGDPSVDYAFVDWTAFTNSNSRGGLRLGRVKNDFGLYNATRDVAFTRPSIILPQSIYFEQARNLEMAADGLGFYYERYGDRGNVYLRYNMGYGQVGERSIESAFIGRDYPGKFDSRLLHLVNLSYEEAQGRYILGLTSAWGGMKFDPRPSSPIRDGNVDFHPVVLSAQYNWEKWSVTGECFVEFVRYRDFGPALPNRDPVAQSYYLQASYRPANKWETFVRYDEFYADRADRDGKKFAAATGLPAFSAYGKDWTVGLRYDVTPSFMLRAELHHVNGTGWLSSLENSKPGELEQHWDMFMLLGSFRF